MGRPKRRWGGNVSSNMRGLGVADELAAERVRRQDLVTAVMGPRVWRGH